VLRITPTRVEGVDTLKVEGRLAGQWVEELARAAASARAAAPRVVLDLAQVTFVDADGIVLLRALRDGGVALTDCSSFVSRLIDDGGTQ
jgi:anti-anti-sigma regulatory factor